MILHTANNYVRFVLPYVALFLLCYLVNFSHLDEHGYMADDWGIVTRHQSVQSHVSRYPVPHRLRVALQLARFSGRPLLSVQYLLDWASFSLGGRQLWALAGCAVLALNAHLLFLLSRRQLPTVVSFAIGCCAILFPGDTTSQWLTMSSGRLAFAISLLACFAFARRHDVIAAVLLLAALMWYEVAAVLFVLAPWSASGGKWCDIWRGARIVFFSGSAWLVTRVLMYILGERGYGGQNMESLAGVFSSEGGLFNYLSSFPTAIVLGLYTWPSEAMRIALLPDNRVIFLSGILAVGAFVFLLLRKSNAREPQIRCRLLRRDKFTVFRITCNDATCNLVTAVICGCVLIAASAVPSFKIGPTAEWGILSRANYTLGFGVALVIPSAFAILYGARVTRFWRLTIVVVFGVLISSWMTTRHHYQMTFVKEIAEEKVLIAAIIEDLGELPKGTVICVNGNTSPEEHRIVRRLSRAPLWEIKSVFHAFYGYNVKVVRDGAKPRVAPRVSDETQSTSEVLVDLATGDVEWKKHPGENQNNAVTPNLFLLEYLSENR